MPSTSTLAATGLILSVYAVYVEYKTAHQEEEEEPFQALCDIDAIKASCSAVFALPEGHLLSYLGIVPRHSTLDVPNALLGAFYYAYTLLLRHYLPVPVTQLAAVAAMCSTILLAYKLTVLQLLCLVCWATHVLNTFLLIRAFAGDTAVPKKKKKTKTA